VIIMIERWTPQWSTPVFSLEERDRRWKKVRDLMARDGIDLILCFPNTNRRDRGQQDSRYLTQLGENCEETTVVFPIEGETTAWQTRAGATPSSIWLNDVRAARYGAGAEVIIPHLREMGFQRGTLGIAGLTGSLLARTRAPEGEANWQSVEMIKQAFSEARVVSATDVLAEARYQKSAEEIDFIKKGVEVAEGTMRTIVEHARVGVVERHVFAHMLYASADAGGSMPVMFGWISGPLGNTYTRLEQPSFRKFAAGDVLMTEIEGRWGGYIGQIDEGFSIGPAHPDFIDATKLSWESFNRVLEIMKPGVTVRELINAGSVRGMNGRGVANLTLHGRGTGDDGPLVTPRSRSPEVLALEIKEGCCMIIKPAATVDGKPNYGRWGDCAVVGEKGAERLGTRPQQIYQLI
jgi:Xaa-Pro dipeptidase